MKTLNVTTEKRRKVLAPSVNKPGISDHAFYLIALITLLKKDIYPAAIKDYLRPGNSAGFSIKP